MAILRSRDNPRVRHWRRLVEDRQLRRRAQRAWIEGVRLIGAYLDAHGEPLTLIVSEAAQDNAEIARLVARTGTAPVVLSASLFAELADTETPQGIGAEIALPQPPRPPADLAQAVFLDGIQDPGNLGAILRSAAAFEVPEVVLGAGCADPWSPKVLRAAMGAHFALCLRECAELWLRFAEFAGEKICTVPRDGTPLQEIDLRGPHAWAFGGEGRGVSRTMLEAATRRACIPIAQTTESLNVAVAASLCLYEAARQRRAPRPPRQ
jgi:RNA methyltransferase, TrmH family